MKRTVSTHIVRLIVLFVLLSLPVFAQGAQETHVGGRVFTDAGPLEGAKIYAYASYGEIEAGKPVRVSSGCDRLGAYSLDLPKGEYYFVARGDKDGKAFFAFHGNNPIKVETNNTWIALLATEIRKASLTEGETALTGVVTYKGAPLKGAYVSLYKPDSKHFMGLGFRTESAADDGTFRYAVPSGKYVVIAKHLNGEKGNRPLKKGDLYCYAAQNPIEVRENSVTSIEIPCYPKNDRTAFIDTPQTITDSYKTIETLASETTSGIRGKITDAKGNPVPGILVLAYPALKPVFLTYYVSHGTQYWAETGKDGSYFIPVDTSGDYYLVARNTLGDGPHKGELYGLYNANSRHAVTFQKGKVLDQANISVSKIMDEPVKGAPMARLGSEPPSAGAEGLPSREITRVGDQVITADTVWRGDVLVTGVVLVKKGATLTLKPGTTVRFVRIDQDNNGVGDGELRVEGRMIARGTPQRRILFTSAQKHPQTRDWSYIHLLASQADNRFEYCQFEYGFSGIQTHYSKASISDCVFANNYEGLHFNTSDVTADHNTFVKNGSAFRFKRLEGKVVISNNEVRGNEIGVLFGRQQINAVDFENLNRAVDIPVFRNNNFDSNEKYNFSMGNGQNLGIAAPDNWWGSSDAARIEETVFDRRSDGALGKLDYAPFLSTPVVGAGVRE